MTPASKSKKTESAEKKDVEPEAKADDDTEQELKADEETIKASSSLDLSIMKELGAKNKAEVLDKIKGFRKAISGKLEADPGYMDLKGKFEYLQNAAKNDQALWADLAKGEPRAIEYAKVNYGIDLSKKSAPKSSNRDEDYDYDDTTSDDGLIPREKFIDEEAADAVNSVLSKLYAKVENMERFRSEYEKRTLDQQSTLAKQEAQNSVVDEMVRVAAEIPNLKDVPNIREAIVAWRKGANDPRMDYYSDLMAIANKEKVNLIQAMEIDRGRKAALAVVKAKDEGRKEAYNHKPNKSLSDLQGKGIDKPEDYSEAEVRSMIESGNMPDHWFDENDEPNPKTIPKSAWKEFWPGGNPY